jgi:phosphoglycerate kinase
MKYRTIQELTDIAGKKIILRLDFNVPIRDGKVVDDYRIKKSLETIAYLRDKQAKIIIISHIETGSDTLKPVFEYIKNILPITFCEDCIEKGKEAVDEMKPGEMMLCENLRLYDGEKKNDEAFSKQLAALGDYYVNDAFSVSHRKHASVVGIPKWIPGYMGFQFQEEVKQLSLCFNPSHPFIFILGGAKFETKLPLVEKFVTIADTIFIDGALADDIFKAQGLSVGTSKVSDQPVDLSHFIKNQKIIVPVDVRVQDNVVKHPDHLLPTDAILDAGPETIEVIKKHISQAKSILWNGPLGNYENGYKDPTLEVARAIAESGAHSVVGGGDTLAAIAELGLESKFSFISTGGGAMLDFLAEGSLPGIEALKR